MLIGGKPLMGLLFGKAFLGAYAPLVILMAIPSSGFLVSRSRPMLYALGRSDGPLKAKLLGSAAFFVSIAPLAWRWEHQRRCRRPCVAECREYGRDDGSPPRRHRRVRVKPA